MNTFMNYLANLLPTVSILKRVVTSLFPGFLLLGGMLIFLGGQPNLHIVQAQIEKEAEQDSIESTIEHYQDDFKVTTTGNTMTLPVQVTTNPITTKTPVAPNIRSQQTQPLMFIENVGQFEEDVLFKANSDLGTFHFTNNAIWLTVLNPITETTSTLHNGNVGYISQAQEPRGVNLKMWFQNANPNPNVVGINPTEAKISYFTAKNIEDSFTNVPVYSGIRYEDVYPGIDIEFTGENGYWLPRIITTPAADLSQVQLEVDGARSQAVEANNIRFDTAVGQTRLPLFSVEGAKPSSLPKPSLSGQTFSTPFSITANNVLETAGQDDLIYSALIGGSNSEYAYGLAVDNQGAAYVSGLTYSTDLPTTPGVIDDTNNVLDHFIFKLNSEGNGLAYLTYFAQYSDIGNQFASRANDIAVDDNGNAYLVGTAGTDSVPTTPGAQQSFYAGNWDTFVIKLNPEGNQLIYATYLGGSNGDVAQSIKVNDNGEAFVAGVTNSADFPTTNGSWQEDLNGAYDVYVAKYDPNGLLDYSTFVGGSDDDSGVDIAIDNNDSVYIAGTTQSIDFPTTAGVIKPSNMDGDSDVFVVKLNPAGNMPIYSTLLGGSNDDGTYSNIAIDVTNSGEAYVSGSTSSSDFFTTSGAFQENYAGDTDIFVVKLNSSATQYLYSTFLGGTGYEVVGGIDVDSSGRVYVTGNFQSGGDFPTSSDAYQSTSIDDWDAYIVKLSPDGQQLEYGTYLGGWSEENSGYGAGIVVDSTGVYVAGETFSEPSWPGGFPVTYDNSAGAWTSPDVYVVKLDIVNREPSIFPGQDWNVECPFCSVADSQQYVEGVNPRTGNFTHQESFLNTPVAGGTLSFDFSYIAEATDMYTTTMGYGWAHNNEMSLHFDSTALTHTVILQAPGGSRFPFYGNGDGSYERYAGVTSDLVRTDGATPEDTTYEVTTYNQFKARFNHEGKLTEREDPHGNIITFQYADFNGTERLYRAVQGSRYLEYDYYGDGRLHTVKDNNNRTVTLTYDGNGDLATVTDPTPGTTGYQYEGEHLLNRVIDATNRTVKAISYDTQGRAYQVRDGEDNLLVDIDFGGGSVGTFAMGGGVNFDDLSATSIVTASSVVMTFSYGTRGTLSNVLFNCDAGTAGCQNESTVGYNYNFKQDNVEDVNGNPTTMVWNSGGSNLESVTDALGQQTQMGYDSFNNLTQTIDARGLTTTHRYDNPAFPTFRTSQTNALSQTTIYTPTTVADGVPGMLKAEQNPSGVVTTYKYDSFGQVLETVQAAGTTEAITHTYGYDLGGNLETYSRISGSDIITTRNFYDASDRLLATIANWDGVLDWMNCTFEAGPKDENICTLYGYDTAGRTISNTNALGQTNLTFYDGAGRSFLSVINYDGTAFNENDPLSDLCDFNNPDPELNHCNLTEYDEFGRVVTTTDSIGRMNVIEYDSLNRISRSITNWEDGVFDANEPDRDIEMRTQYDAVGNTLIVTDTVGRMTRTFYDALDRLEGSIDNWTGSITLDDCSTLPAIRDENICTLYAYDPVGNTIIVTDTLGRMSRTFYDELDREQATVENWNPNTLLTAEDCVLDPDNNRSENICTMFGYDDGGNLVTVTNALSQTTLTVYDAANRPFITVQNWDGTPINSVADCSFPPEKSDTNVCSVTYFDILGRQSASKDPMGNIIDITYDNLGRTVTTTQYLDGTPIPSHTIYDAFGNHLNQVDVYGNSPTNQYDSLNRLQTTTSTEGVARTQQYNAVGWVITTTNNLSHTVVNGYDLLGRRTTVTNAEGDMISYRYDPLGNQVAMIDAEGITTTYEYDGLNRLVVVIENDVPGDNPTNETDVRTTYVHDAFGNRVMVTNARGLTNTFTIYDDLNRPEIVEDALGNRTQTQYNALGMPTVITDANNAATQYFFDGLNRLSSVHYLADGKVFSYAYDAVGNRTVMTDSVGITQYEYDDLYRVITVTNPFSGQIVYDYNLLGQRTHLTYPDGKVVTYTYDNDYRMETVLDWDAGTTIYHYDDIGRLITTTLPNGVNTINRYDDANRLVELTHVAADDTLLAQYEYELDKMGNRRVVTETVLHPEMVASIDAFLEENGMVVVEAESGQLVAGSNHDWISRTVQTGYTGDAYLRTLPDVGEVLSGQEAANGPQVNFPVQLDTAGSYAVWVRGMGADAGGDSVHVGLDGQTVTTADNITGFTVNEWQWSRLTMDGSDASLDVTSSGVYTVGLLMREDGLHVDKMLLITDTNYIPTGSGPIESLQQTITNTVPAQLVVQTMDYGYDPLYRLTDATYSGAVSATYAYEYDPVGNMEVFTETVGGVTTIINRAFNDANQLIAATDTELGTTSYYYDDNGNLTEIWPPGTNAQNLDGIIRYGFSQGNLLTTQEMYAGGWQLQAEFVYDGNNNRVQQINHTNSVTTTYHNDNMGLSQVLLADDGTTQTVNLFGLDLIAVDDGSETRILLADALGSVRMEMVENEVASSRIYDPYGNVLLQTGSRDTVYGYTGEQEDASTGLVYLRARYYNPSLNQFMSRDSWRGNGMRPITMHGYAYGYNSPPNFSDPTGHDPASCGAEPHNARCNLIKFSGATEEENWTFAEKFEVNKAARKVAYRLAVTYNEYMGMLLDIIPENVWQYVSCISTDRPLTSHEAFMYFYGGQVWFYKTGTDLNPNRTTFGQWIGTNNKIEVYTDIYEINADGSRGKSKIPKENNGYRWATHELGHGIEYKINVVMKNTMNIKQFVRNYLPTNILNRDGFAGPFPGWQQSTCNEYPGCEGEIFADMFLGWTYQTWDTSDEYLADATAKADFMNRHMPSWIALVINRNKRNAQ